jgi:hypothetical protein
MGKSNSTLVLCISRRWRHRARSREGGLKAAAAAVRQSPVQYTSGQRAAAAVPVRSSALGTRTRARTDVDKQVEAGSAPALTMERPCPAGVLVRSCPADGSALYDRTNQRTTTATRQWCTVASVTAPISRTTVAWFRWAKGPKIFFSPWPSHRIFRWLYGALNVSKKNN